LSALALWCAATALAAGVVWIGVRGIGDAARSETALVLSPTASATAGGPSTTVAGVSTAPAPTAPVPPTTAPPTDPPPIAPSRPAPAPTAPPAAGSAPPATAPVTVPPTVPPDTVATTQTFALVGGSVTVRFLATAVEVVLATPNPGFRPEVDQRGATAIRVEFESPSHRSRLDAAWNDGPDFQIRED
jgi:hypothetical protein